MTAGFVVTALLCWVIGLLGAVPALWLTRRIRRNLVEILNLDLEIASHVRLTLEDLHSRDPQIAESLEVALLEMESWERRARRALRVMLAGRS